MATTQTATANPYAQDAQKAKFRQTVSELYRKRKDPNYVKFALEQVGYDGNLVDQELSRMQAIESGQPVPTVQPSTAIDLTPEKRNNIQIENTDRQNLINNAAKYKELVDKYGFESTVANPEIAGQMSGLRAGLLSDIKKAETLGTLDKGLLDFADILLGSDPTGPMAPIRNIGGVNSKAISSKIDELISSSQAKIDANKGLLGETTQQTDSQTPQSSQVEQAKQWLQANPNDPRAEKVKAKLLSLEGGVSASPSPEQAQQQGGFLGDLSKSFDQRTGKNADILNSKDSNVSKVLQVTGQNLGLFSDAVGSAVVNTLKAVTPDFIEKPAGEKINELVKAGLDTEVAKKTITSWEDFKRSNPEMARNVEASGNIANFFAMGLGAGKGADLAKKGAVTGSQIAVDTAKTTKASIGNTTEKVLSKATDVITPIDTGVENVLKNTNPVKFEKYISRATEAASDYSVSTPLEMAGQEAVTTLKTLRSNGNAIGKTKSQIVSKIGEERVGSIADEARSEFRIKSSDILGTTITKNGVKSSVGRVSNISDSADISLIKDVDTKLAKLGSNPTFRQVDDTIDYIQDILYKRSSNTAIPVNTKVQSITKGVIAKLNKNLQEIGGPEYKLANQQYGEVMGVVEKLNKLLGKEGDRGGSLMKRVFSPSDAGTKKLFAKVKELTGVDLVEEATLAKFAMEKVGDARQASLLEEVIKGVPTNPRSFVAAAAEKAINKLQDPVGKARRMVGKK